MEAPVRSSLGQWLRPGEGGGRGVQLHEDARTQTRKSFVVLDEPKQFDCTVIHDLVVLYP